MTVTWQPNYDSLDGAAGWARDSLELHAADPREALYTLEQMESAQSHEDIWNAAQRQMIVSGKMHGFMRMYWAKKILEWSPSPEEVRAIKSNGCSADVLVTHYCVSVRPPPPERRRTAIHIASTPPSNRHFPSTARA